MGIQYKEALQRMIDSRDLTHDEMLAVMWQVMSGELTPAQIAGLLIGLRVKGETPDEIAAAAQVMRELAARVDVKERAHLIDTCGTGGDGAHTFNVSTASAFVAAAAGAKVAKHGGRSVSSACGSADVLEALGVNVDLAPEHVSQCVNDIGIGFMFAPNHHSAMRFAAPVRRELGVRTLFNLLGPLTNPAGATRQVMGVFHHELTGLLAQALQHLGSEHLMVVHGADGMDEISFSGDTYVAELKGGSINEYVVNPVQFGLPLHDIRTIQVENAEQSRDMLDDVLAGKLIPARDIVLLNAGAAIYVSGLAANMQQGMERAKTMIDSGAAQTKLEQLAALSQKLAAEKLMAE